jgi:hypothetical protein
MTRAAAILLAACWLPGAVFAQPDYFFEGDDSGIYGIRDRHFRGVLFPEAYKTLPSAKAAYPGLWEVDRSVAGAGLLPDQIANSGGLGWNALYAYADIDISPGSAGLWLGNFNIGDSFRIFEYYDVTGGWEVSEFFLRGAGWLSPYRNERIRGVSVIFDIAELYAYNGNDYEGLYNDKDYYINVNALVQISDKYSLKAALYTRNRHAENPEDTREDSRKLFTDGFSVGILDDKLRVLELRGQNTFAADNAGKKSDTLSLSLRYSHGRAWSYGKHTLFLGIKADAGAAYPSKISQRSGSFLYYHYLRRVTGEGRAAGVSAAAPVVADISIYGPLRVMASICPSVRYTRIAPLMEPKNDIYRNPQHIFAMELSEVEISLRGPVGDRFDFILMPTIKNGAFFSAAEARFKIGK